MKPPAEVVRARQLAVQCLQPLQQEARSLNHFLIPALKDAAVGEETIDSAIFNAKYSKLGKGILDTQDFVTQDELESICQTLGLPIAPVLYKGKAKDAPMLQSVDALLSYADTIEYAPGRPAEGVVVRVDKKTRPKVRFKAISNNLLLKYKL